MSDSTMERLSALLPEWLETSRLHTGQGKVASYIPELVKASQDELGIHIMDAEGNHVSVGDCGVPFTMQSVSKVFTLILALMDHGEEAVFFNVGKEPTGDDYDSMIKLELVEPGIPFNPFINAGAITVSSLIGGDSKEEKSRRILEFFRKLAHNDQLGYNEEVFHSEWESGHLNRSLAYF